MIPRSAPLLRLWLRRFGHAALAVATLTVALALAPAQADAQPKPLTVPDSLKPWVPWVLHDGPSLDCAQLRPGQHSCAWPGLLVVDTTRTGGKWRLTVWLDEAEDVRLPGDAKLWPNKVRVDGAPGVVGDTGGHPAVRLEAGQHEISGEFTWPRTPEVLPIPPQTGMVDLTVDGVSAKHPRLDAEGRLWLQAKDVGDAAETDSVRVSIHRQLSDGVPLRVANRFELNVSGRAREVVLEEVLMADSSATRIKSTLPVQVVGDDVKVYVKPGTWAVEIVTVVAEAKTGIIVPTPKGEGFDAQEVWVWRPDEALRSVELTGLPSVDPERTTLPPEWRGGTTFLAEPGKTLALRETRRGETEPAPNALTLHRKLWLDLDGDGYTVRDRLQGTMAQGWRLNTTSEVNLGRVSQNNTDLLITADPESKQQGVELRAAKLNLEAEMRLEDARGDIGAVGWDHDVQQLSAELVLPPGWELLGGSGADQMTGTWFDSWTLFDFFFVLMIALSLGKLCGWKWTPVALVVLCLTHGHTDAPQWVWIHLLVSLALLRVLPEGWWRRGVLVYRALAVLFLIILMVPYARDQVRFSLHPQVQDYGSFYNMDNNQTAPLDDLLIQRNKQEDSGGEAGFFGEEEDKEAADMPVERPQEVARKEPKKRKLGASKLKSLGESRWNQSAQLQQIDPNAVVQTGPGLPQWEWRTWRLSWTGPVRKDHRVSLWLISPNANRALTALRVALLILLGWLMLALKDMKWRKPGTPPKEEGEETDEDPGGAPPTPPSPPGPAAAAAVLLLLASLGYSSLADAQQPPVQQRRGAPPIATPAMLQELENRLVAQKRCEGACVVAHDAHFTVKGQTLQMRATVDARQDSAWFLPGPVDPLRIEEVLIDNVPTKQLRREAGGLMAVRLPAGHHVVEIRGTLVNRNIVNLQLDPQTRPRFVTFESEDWAVDGITDTGLADDAIQLTRSSEDRPGGAPTELEGELPPWYTVDRVLALGLPWQMTTNVTRENSDRPQLVKIPLLPGEKVISEAFRVEDGVVIVDFPRGIGSLSYTSELDIVPKMTLTAAKDQPWTESWTVECSRIWRCAFGGLAPVLTVDGAATYKPLYRPWPTESLTIDINRPEGTPGQAATVDKVNYQVTPGTRLLQATLTLRVRASQGGWQKIVLPPEAELQSAKVDNTALTIRPRDGTLTMPVKPGSQQMVIAWQQPWERSLIETAPKVSLGSSSVNNTVSIVLGEDRWLLWTTGPAWGPAILFWSHLILLLLAALLLGRLKASPLKTWEWLLFALGMAQIPVALALVPIGWFFVLAWREKRPLKPWWGFDLLQVGLVILTLVTIGVVYGAIHTNLLLDVDMQVRGADSTGNFLRWYVDRIEAGEQLPSASILSVPLLVWRVTLLLWALWLVARLLKWAPWAWKAFGTDGLWKKPPKLEPRRVNVRQQQQQQQQQPQPQQGHRVQVEYAQPGATPQPGAGAAQADAAPQDPDDTTQTPAQPAPEASSPTEPEEPTKDVGDDQEDTKDKLDQDPEA